MYKLFCMVLKHENDRKSGGYLGKIWPKDVEVYGLSEVAEQDDQWGSGFGMQFERHKSKIETKVDSSLDMWEEWQEEGVLRMMEEMEIQLTEFNRPAF